MILYRLRNFPRTYTRATFVTEDLSLGSRSSGCRLVAKCWSRVSRGLIECTPKNRRQTTPRWVSAFPIVGSCRSVIRNRIGANIFPRDGLFRHFGHWWSQPFAQFNCEIVCSNHPTVIHAESFANVCYGGRLSGFLSPLDVITRCLVCACTTVSFIRLLSRALLHGAVLYLLQKGNLLSASVITCSEASL